MKVYIDKPEDRIPNPCDTCNGGFGSISGGTDEKGDWVEVVSCHDTCKLSAEHTKKMIDRIMSKHDEAWKELSK